MNRTTPLKRGAPMRRVGFKAKGAPAPRIAKECAYVARPREPARASAELPMRAPALKFAYVRDKRLRAMCMALPCQSCRGPGADWAHSNQSRHGKGRQVKASDVYVAALCWPCHQELDQGIHFDNAQKIALWNRWHISTVAAAITLGLWPTGIPTPPLEDTMPDPDLTPRTNTPGITARTLIDGRVVTSDSPEWIAECQRWHKHVLNLRGRSIEFIKGYVQDVRRSEGDLAAQRVKDAYANDWELTKRAEAEAVAQQGGAA